MCIIMMKPKGSILSEDLLREAWKDNPHGSGFTYVEPGTKRFKVYKELNSVDAIVNKYKNKVIDSGIEKEVDLLWHSRVKSVGEINSENIHPFYINSHHMMMAHNGTIRKGGLIDDKSEKSDTVQIAEWIDKELPRNFFDNKACITLFTDYLGYTKSRLVFLKADGFTIINEDEGEWRDGVWFSKKRPAVTVYSSYSGRSARGIDDDDEYYYGYSRYPTKPKILDYSKSSMFCIINGNRVKLDQFIYRKAWSDKCKKSAKSKPDVRFLNKKELDDLKYHNWCSACYAPILGAYEIKIELCETCRKIGELTSEHNGFGDLSI